jgi:hypothetical protein
MLIPAVPIALIGMGLRHAALASVLLSPLAVAFASGVVGYCRGTAALREVGLPGTTFHNLDPGLRCGRATSGCIDSGNKWVTHLPNNVAVSMMTRLFGPQRGAYTGPYPTEAEAIAAVTNAPPLAVSQVAAGTIRMGDREVRLDADVGPGLLRAAHGYFDPSLPGEAAAVFPDESGPIRAALWKGRCLILRIPTGDLHDPREPAQAACIAVCDVASGRPFAYYAEGEYYHRFPPVPWRPR